MPIYNPHAYEDNTVAEVLRQPMYPLGKCSFTGSGVYLLYYFGDLPLYADLPASRLIYAGKSTHSVSTRITAHTRSIKQVEAYADEHGEVGLKLADFKFRHLLLVPKWEGVAEDLFIERFAPWWTQKGFLGFGNDGSQRVKVNEWDHHHPGRPRALGKLKCDGTRLEQRVRGVKQQGLVTKLFG